MAIFCFHLTFEASHRAREPVFRHDGSLDVSTCWAENLPGCFSSQQIYVDSL